MPATQATAIVSTKRERKPRKSATAGWLVLYLCALVGINVTKQHSVQLFKGHENHGIAPEQPQETPLYSANKNGHRRTYKPVYVSLPTSNGNNARAAHSEPTLSTYSPQGEEQETQSSYDRCIHKKGTCKKVRGHDRNAHGARISPINARKLINPGEKWTSSSYSSANNRPHKAVPPTPNFAAASTILDDGNSDFLSETSAEGKEATPKGAKEGDLPEVQVNLGKQKTEHSGPRERAVPMEEENPNDAQATHDNTGNNQTINGATCDLQQDCGGNSESVLPPQESRSHHSGTARTPQQNGRGTDTAQRDKREVNAGSGKISRDGEKEKTLKGQHKERKQYIRSESEYGNGGERGPLSGGDDYSPNSHKTPKKIRDRSTETPHVDGEEQYPKKPNNKKFWRWRHVDHITKNQANRTNAGGGDRSPTAVNTNNKKVRRWRHVDHITKNQASKTYAGGGDKSVAPTNLNKKKFGRRRQLGQKA